MVGSVVPAADGAGSPAISTMTAAAPAALPVADTAVPVPPVRTSGGTSDMPAVAVTALGPALAGSSPPGRIATVELPPALTARTNPPASPVSPTAAPAAKPEPAREAVTSVPRRGTSNAKPEEKKDAKAGGTARGVKLAALDATEKRPLSAKEKAAAAKLDQEAKPEKGAKAGKDPAAGSKSAKDGKAGATAKGGKAAKDADDSKTATKAKTRAGTAERYWVQVASGSNKANLDKAWANVKGKAPGQLAGQTTYTAPWRASNRLLIGPFKSEDEAQAKVNALAKAGVGAIQFTTRAGADVEKVATR
jgi:hypothetical protein